MINTTRTAALALALSCGVAAAQSASYSLSASATTVAAGDSITVTLSADPDTAGAGSGVFGPAGLYGFGGTIQIAGDAAADASASAASILADLPSGATVSTGGADAVRAGAGRGLADALPAQVTDLLSFQIDIDPAAEAGTFTIGFDGAVVLVEGDALETYSTNPGANQNSLGGAPLEITIGGGGCNPADLSEPFGVLDLTDIDTFIIGFGAGDAVADVAAPFGVLDLTDIDTFIIAFGGGCP